MSPQDFVSRFLHAHTDIRLSDEATKLLAGVVDQKKDGLVLWCFSFNRICCFISMNASVQWVWNRIDQVIVTPLEGLLWLWYKEGKYTHRLFTKWQKIEVPTWINIIIVWKEVAVKLLCCCCISSWTTHSSLLIISSQLVSSELMKDSYGSYQYMYYVSLWSRATTFPSGILHFINKPMTESFGVKKKNHRGTLIFELYSKETSNHQRALSGVSFFVDIPPISHLLLPPSPSPLFFTLICMYLMIHNDG